MNTSYLKLRFTSSFCLTHARTMQNICGWRIIAEAGFVDTICILTIRCQAEAVSPRHKTEHDPKRSETTNFLHTQNRHLKHLNKQGDT